MMTLIDEAAAGASPKVAKCLAASVTTRTNGVNACTDGIRRGDAEWIYSAPSRNGLKSRREDLVHRVCAQPIGPHDPTSESNSIGEVLTLCALGVRDAYLTGLKSRSLGQVSRAGLASNYPA